MEWTFAESSQSQQEVCLRHMATVRSIMGSVVYVIVVEKLESRALHSEIFFFFFFKHL